VKPTGIFGDGGELDLRSDLGAEYHEELEQLFFFNPRQPLVIGRVRQHIEQYGAPGIVARDGRIRIDLAKTPQAQNLFILLGEGRAKLVGAGVHVREGEKLRVLYLALKPVYSLDWRTSFLFIECLARALRAIGRRIEGVRVVEFCLAKFVCIFRIPREEDWVGWANVS